MSDFRRKLRLIRDVLMDKFIAKENIAHYQEALAKETDEAKRQTLASLLAEEEAKLAAALNKEKQQKQS